MPVLKKQRNQREKTFQLTETLIYLATKTYGKEYIILTCHGRVTFSQMSYFIFIKSSLSSEKKVT